MGYLLLMKRVSVPAVLLLFLLSAGLRAAPAPARVLPGIDVLLDERLDLLKGKRVGLVTHAAAVTAGLEPTVDALARSVRLVVLIGPEHGVRGAAYAGEKVDESRDAKTGLPMYAIFDDKAKPTPEMLKGVDVLVYDVQDIGSRSYTYITTLARVMEAAAEARIPLVVLDRPDPLGGLRVEGNVPPKDWARVFVCWLRLPYVYGMTPGELARMINGEGWLPGGLRADLTVVPLKNWKRSMLFAETGLPWVPTSPHIPHAATVPFYPATGLISPVLNNGVGYPMPFELVGAPWLDGEKLAEKLNSLGLAGVRFRPLVYKPFYGRFKGEMCGGVQIHLLDPARAPLFELNFHVLDAVNALYPERRILRDVAGETTWKDSDNALGDSSVRRRLDEGRPLQEFLSDWRRDAAEFAESRKKYLLYE